MEFIMVPMTASEFRSRFASAFSIKPDLEIDDFHDILLSNNWDEKASLRQVMKMSSESILYSGGLDEEDPESSEELFQPVKLEDSGSEPVPKKKDSKSKKSTKSPENPTTVTKWIGKLAGGLFVRTLLVCDGEKALQDKGCLEAAVGSENMTMEALIDLTVDPETIRRAGWTGREVTLEAGLVDPPLWHDEITGKIGYGSAVVDGTTIYPGDFVTVRPGTDNNRPASASRKVRDPEVTASIWYAHIEYIFESADGPCAHMHWLSHGGDTILGETAGPRELFVIHRCDDASLGSIAGKVLVDYVGKNDATGQDGLGVVELNYTDVNHYFYRLAYSEADERFEEIQDLGLEAVTGKQCCNCCDRKSKQNSGTQIKSWTKDGQVESIVHQEVKYGLEDFVYLTPKEYGEPYTIAQITGFRANGLRQWMKSSSPESNSDLRVSVQLYHRYVDLLEPYFEEYKRGVMHRIRDCRRLYRDTYRFLSVTLDRLDGKCIVRHINRIENLNELKDLDDAFFVADHITNLARTSGPGGGRHLADLQVLVPGQLVPSEDNDGDFAIELSRFKNFVSNGRKLRAMEVFSGAGGLAVGLDESEAVITTWAIEYDTLAAQTFKRNFPAAKVYNQDANILLRQAIEEHLGISKEALKDLEGNPLPRMPWPGEVDLLYGGPPCQDFSRCNRYKKANSIKNSLLATYLSYVDHYRPKYFLLENVQELLSHRLGSSQVDIHKTQGGIEMGSAKFILRALTSLGYQAHFAVLQAAEHGTPQSRTRVFFWGSAPGYALPEYPEPTHIFPAGRAPKYTRRTRRSAPHRTVTVGDAISDLPAFDWNMDPPGDLQPDRLARHGRGILQVHVGTSKLGIGPRTRGYHPFMPNSEYQRHVRQNVQQDEVHNHYTCRWIDSIMLRVLKIPLRPGANHLDLPPEEDMRCLRAENSAALRHAFYHDRYRRLDYEKTFQTCLTKIDPSGKNGSVLHPTQHRVLTVREQARAMGFPDTFTWDSKTQTPKDMYKQIGNAVAIPVGRALGRELLKVMVQKRESSVGSDSSDDVLESIEMDYEGDRDVSTLDDEDVKQESDEESMFIGTPRRVRRAALTGENENGDVEMDIY